MIEEIFEVIKENCWFHSLNNNGCNIWCENGSKHCFINTCPISKDIQKIIGKWFVEKSKKIYRVIVMDERTGENDVAKGNVVQVKDDTEFIDFLLDTGFTIRLFVEK